jgi:hypothetical protein
VNGGRDHAPGKNKSVVPINENCDGMISGLRLGPGYCPPPATYVATVQGAPRRVQKRSAEIPGALHMSVDPLPTAHPSGEMWANAGHPVSPDKLAFAVGAVGNTFTGHGMRWDNSGKNAHYAPIRWSSQS